MDIMDKRIRPVMRALADQERARRRHEGLGWPEAEPLLAALEAAGIDTVDFGRFGEAAFTNFDFERAVPILVDWLPRVEDPNVKDAMVRSLTGQRTARGEGTRRLIAEFRRPEYADETSLRWAIGNALATLAGPADADAIIEILRDRSSGMARQMLCDALLRTKDVRRVDVLIDLIEDDSVAGHAILALRRIGRGKLPEPERARPMLEALLTRQSATEFGQRQARAALKSAVAPMSSSSTPQWS
jgi:HEAT repeat protein